MIFDCERVSIDNVRMNKNIDMMIWVTKQGRIIYDYWVMVRVQKHIRHAIE